MAQVEDNSNHEVKLIDEYTQNQTHSTAKVCYDIFNCTYQTLLGYLCLDGCLAISLSFVGRLNVLSKIGMLERYKMPV